MFLPAEQAEKMLSNGEMESKYRGEWLLMALDILQKLRNKNKRQAQQTLAS